MVFSGSLLYSCNFYSEKSNKLDFFPQGIGSGDPKEDGITLWTRINPDLFVTDKITVQVSDNPDFKTVILDQSIKVNETENFTVKAYINSPILKPFSTYYYRFKYDSVYSPVGKFKTLPSDQQEIEHLRIGILNCQDYSTGFFTVYKFLSREDVDYILFLGDYIYEYSYDKNAKKVFRKISLPSGKYLASTQEDYYFLYNTYKADPYLKELHQNHTFIMIWDDHEFANDCFGFNAPDHFLKDEEQLKKLRIYANRAYFYSNPLNVPFNEKKYEGIKLYRDFKIGKLAKLILTDERLFRNPHPCGEEKVGERIFSKGCGNEKLPSRTMLGKDQLSWFFNTIEDNSVEWVLWANPVTFMQMKIKDYYVSFDSWDGYQYERDLILEKVDFLKKENVIKNFVILTGDLHSFVAGYCTLENRKIAPEFITTSATSGNLDEILPLDIDIIEKVVRYTNKHIKFFDTKHNGYSILDIYKDRIDVTFKFVDTKNKNGKILKTKKFRVVSGKNSIEEEK